MLKMWFKIQIFYDTLGKNACINKIISFEYYFVLMIFILLVFLVVLCR